MATCQDCLWPHATPKLGSGASVVNASHEYGVSGACWGLLLAASLLSNVLPDAESVLEKEGSDCLPCFLICPLPVSQGLPFFQTLNYWGNCSIRRCQGDGWADRYKPFCLSLLFAEHDFCKLFFSKFEKLYRLQRTRSCHGQPQASPAHCVLLRHWAQASPALVLCSTKVSVPLRIQLL